MDDGPKWSSWERWLYFIALLIVLIGYVVE